MLGNTREARSVKAADGTDIYFEAIGDRSAPAIFMGPHFYLSRFADDESFTDRWIEGLRDEFFVVLADYPRGIGRTRCPQGVSFSPDVAAEEYARIADAAGVNRFAWLGYSFGGAMGIQVACRTDRITALAIGGFPPLNAPYRLMVDSHRQMAHLRLPEGIDPEVILSAIGFYSPLVSWPERQELGQLVAPRMVFMGERDGVQSSELTGPLADILRASERELRMLGWQVAWLPGQDHRTALNPSASLPFVQKFFREVLLRR